MSQLSQHLSRSEQEHAQGGPSHVALLGPTASGKSWLAMQLAQGLGDFELVSIDSMQVYRGMDIGTAKPTPAEQEAVAHHLLDLVEPSQDFALADFQRAARDVIADIERRGKRAILVGGTGLYLQAVVDELQLPGQYPDVRDALQSKDDPTLFTMLREQDPIAASRIEPDNRRRLLRALEVTIGSGKPFSSFGPGLGNYPAQTRFALLGVWLPRDVGARRISERIEQMLAAGWIDEVRRLRDGGGLSRTAAQALGYKELLRHLDGWDLSEATHEIERRTRAFARRQRVWFRRDPRVRWFATASDPRRLLPALLRECAAVDVRGGDES